VEKALLGRRFARTYDFIARWAKIIKIIVSSTTSCVVVFDPSSELKTARLKLEEKCTVLRKYNLR
jgi:hypothetical protein